MRARNASQNRLQSDWRESLWRSFSFNFSIRPPRWGMETSACSVFSRLAVCQALPSCFIYGDVSFDVLVMHARVCVRLLAAILCVNVIPVSPWICATTAYWILLHSIYSAVSLLFVDAVCLSESGAIFRWTLEDLQPLDLRGQDGL